MRGNCTKFLLNFIMMLAFIGAGISPACKFVSGQMVEICGPNGIEIVRLNTDQLPPGTQDHKSLDEQCAFCFAGAHIKTVYAGPPAIKIPQATKVAAERIAASDAAYSLYRPAILPRGPPATV